MAVAEASFKISIDSMSLGLINERGLVVELLPSFALLLGVSPTSNGMPSTM